MTGSSVSSIDTSSQDLLQHVANLPQPRKVDTAPSIMMLSQQSRHSSSLPSRPHNKNSIPDVIVTTCTVNDNLPNNSNHCAQAENSTAAGCSNAKDLSMGIRLISEDAPNKTGELVLDAILTMIQHNGGWNECVGKGKKMFFFELAAKQLFDKERGMLNMVKPVSANVLQNKFCQAVKVLDKIASATHSEHCPDYGEDYPPHLVSLIKKYMDVNEEYDGSKQGKAIPASVVNYQVQKTMDLVPPPIGPDDNAPLRFPTRVGNEASGNHNGLVKRGAQYNKVVDVSYEEMKSKSKKSRTNSSPENIIQGVSKHHDRVSCTLESLSDSILNKNKTSPDEMALKVEKFSFHKEIISKKMEMESNRFSLENKKANQEHLHAKLRVVDERIAKNKSDMKEYKDTEEMELYEVAKKNLLDSMKLKGELEMELFKS